jgi:Leucine-rich repeat (LRR) protein
LETLVLDETRIRYLDDNIVQLPKLKSLSIRSAALSQVPDAMGQLVSLESLDLAMNELCWLPASIGSLKALRVLDVSSNMLMYLPRSLAGLQTLEHLVLGRNFYLLRLPTFLQNSSLIDRVDIRDTPLPGAGPAPAGTFTGKKWDAKASPRGIDWLIKVNEDVLLYVAPEEREFIQKVAKNTYLTENAEFFEEVVSDPKFLEIIDNMDVLFLVNDSHLVRFLCLIENPEAPLPACELRFLKSIIYCTYYRYKKSGLWMQSIKMDNLEELEFSGRHDRDVEPDHAVVNALLAHAPRLRALRIVDDGWNDTFFGCHDDLDMLRRALSNLTVEDVVVPLSLSFAPNLEEFCITSNRETENDKGFLPAGLLEHKKLRSLSISAPRIKLDLGKIVNLQQLESIKITSNSYKSIPEEVYALKNLKAFKLESRNLKEIPAKIGELNELRELRLIGSFAIIPVEIFNLKMLRCLEINSGQVNAIPKGLNQLDQLEELHIDCSIKDVPQSISTLRNLKVLILRSGDVKSFGNLFQDMKLLKKLELDFNRLEKLESNELVLPNLESLRLYLRNAQYRLLYLPRLKRLDTYVSLPRSIIWSESLEQLTLGDEHFPIEPIVI